MKIGYVRVSTVEQNEKRQLKKMNEMKIDKIYIEKISAKDIKGRTQLITMLNEVVEGDTIYVHDFSRLARSTKDLLYITEILAQKKVALISFKENIDTSTATGKLMLTMIGAINEFERTNLLERQKEGIFLAKELGKYKGRKPIPFPDNWENIYVKWKNKEISPSFAMENLNLKKSTFYKLAKEWERK
ncbi:MULTISPECIES: recombinase family protein [unclassified Cetobacterium]|uniref:recombinase family protein n=1 Tax=unclassified Cetobacterium TaxID=2630983 RepID=UPI0006454C32|nr:MULTISPECIES: recombinase family protein [unclassified Cetobacterium]